MVRYVLILVGFTVLLQFASERPVLANPACHSTLLGDTDLTGDLDCSGVPGDPLTIGVDGMVLRLNGWTLTCPPGFVNASGELDVEGVRSTNHSNVKILGPGKIAGCGRAVTLEGGLGNLVHGLYLSDNLTGVVLIGGTNPTVQHNLITGNLGTAVALSATTGARIIDNWLTGNGGDPDPVRGFGITNDNMSPGAVIRRNRILGNIRGGIVEVGASLLVGAKIVQNVVLGNGGLDLDLRGADNTLMGNLCETSNPAGLCPHPLPRLP